MLRKREITDFDVAVGKKFKELRIKKKLSLQAIAEEIGVSRNQVFRWENAQNRMYLYNAVEYCRVLEISPSSFLRMIENEGK